MSTLEAIRAIDRFVYQLEITAGSQIHTLFEKRKKPINIPAEVRDYAKKSQEE